MGRTCCVQKLFLTFWTIFVHNIFSPCSAKGRTSYKDLPVYPKYYKNGKATVKDSQQSRWKMGWGKYILGLIIWAVCNVRASLDSKRISFIQCNCTRNKLYNVCFVTVDSGKTHSWLPSFTSNHVFRLLLTLKDII